MSARRSKAAFALQRKTHAAAALGDRDALSTLLSTPKTCSWSWFTRRSSTPSDLIDPCTGDTLLHAAVRGPEPTCRSLITELLTGSDQLPAIDSRVVNFALATPLHAALSERRLAAAEVRGANPRPTLSPDPPSLDKVATADAGCRVDPHAARLRTPLAANLCLQARSTSSRARMRRSQLAAPLIRRWRRCFSTAPRSRAQPRLC